MNKTIYEEGIEEGVKFGREEGVKFGREEGVKFGREEGRVELLDCAINVLEGRFGPLPAKILTDLKSLSRQELKSMISNSFRISSLDALDFDGLK